MSRYQDLPPDSQSWGRDTEKRLGDLETFAKNLVTLTGGSNSRLSALLNQQKQLLDQQAILLDQQTALSEQVAFLSGQTVYAITDAALYSYYVPGPQLSYHVPYDADRSASVKVTTSGSGVLAVDAQCGWYFSPPVGVNLNIDWSMYVEILSGATVIKGFATGAPQTSVVSVVPAIGAYAARAGGSLTVSGVVTLLPNTTYTIRTRLFANVLDTNNDLYVSPMSLKITKLGI